MQQYLKDLIKQIEALDINAIEGIKSVLGANRQQTIYIAGNGGSQANASHLKLHLAQNGFRAISLFDNVPLLTAFSNDSSYQYAPRKILEQMAKSGDIFLVFSCSGNSSNIVIALDWARQNGMITIGILGTNGGRARNLCNYSIIIPSWDFGIIEDSHSAILHLLARGLVSKGE